MFWGLTPALNLFEEFDGVPDELNVLLIGGADCRHVFKTLSKLYQHKNVKLNFYLMELCPETIAKQLLLYYVALQPETELGLIQRTRIFMELYGNALLRPSTARYLTSLGAEFVKMITDTDYLREQLPNVRLEIKYKERDYLENLFKFWYSSDVFDILDYWDKRLRKTLGVRYDAKSGAFDWDLHMRLKPCGGQTVCSREYHDFRSSGVSFTWLETEATKPNRSMVCGLVTNGDKYLHYGYLGDMVTGPFVAYGLDCDDESMLKRTNNANANRSTDITERNLKQIFSEMLNGDSYVHRVTSSFTLGHLQPAPFDSGRVVDAGPSSSEVGDRTEFDFKPCVRFDNVSVTFVSLSRLESMRYKEKYKSFFDLIYFNGAYMKNFDMDVVANIAKSDCKLIVENRLFVLSNRKKELEEYENEVRGKVETLICKWRALKFDAEKDCYIKYIIKEER